ncbi:MAG: hypothetical protein ACK6D3_23725 [Planctomycetaceae bacterium]
MSVKTWSNRRRWLSVVGPLLLMALASPLLMSTKDCPFGILGLLATCWCIWTGFVFRRTAWWALNLAAVLFALSLVEGFLYWRVAGKTNVKKGVRPPVMGTSGPSDSSEATFETTDLLGTVQVPNSRVSHSLKYGGKTIFDIVYNVDAHGLRIIPTPDSKADPETVAFFGCSFTFGEGVGDQEALPAQVAACAPELHIVNFAYSGYGPHQMLANLESGRVRQICPRAPKVVVFQVIPDQVRRVKGWISYNRHAPRFVLDDGTVRRAGNLDDRWWTPQAWPFLWRSRIFSKLLAPRLVGQADLDLAVALIRQSADEVARQFPGCEFHVLFWNHFDQHLAVPLRRELHAAGIRLHDVETIIPDLEKHGKKYFIPRDGHPNAETHRLLAEYVCREILGERRVSHSDQ